MMCRDDEEVRGNPLVAGFQEDLASDDELRASHQPVSNIVPHAELSSDEDVVETASSQLPKHKGPSSGTTASFGKSGSEQQMSGEAWRNGGITSVRADSSEDERADGNVAGCQDGDVSDDDSRRHNNTTRLSTQQVRYS